MYQFAYSAICEESPDPSSLPRQRSKLPDAIELLEAADKARYASHVRLQLLSDFRRLWLSIAEDLVHEGRDLPPESRASVHKAASSVLEEIERRRFSRDSAAMARPEAAALVQGMLL